MLFAVCTKMPLFLKAPQASTEIPKSRKLHSSKRQPVAAKRDYMAFKALEVCVEISAKSMRSVAKQSITVFDSRRLVMFLIN
jgi:hypothetical protein